MKLVALIGFGLGLGLRLAHADEAVTKETWHKLDLALERYYAKDYVRAAPQLYEVLRVLPESEFKRDSAEFNFADALARLGFTQGAIEQYIDIIEARRSPDLVGRSLEVLDRMVRTGALDEGATAPRVSATNSAFFGKTR